MINKTENYKVTVTSLNSGLIRHLYVLFPLHSKFLCILDFIRLPIEISEVTTVNGEFWERNNDK